MSITDELREYTKHYSVAGSKKDTMLSSIADRIDVEHQKAIRELNNLADASVLLPVDADGEYIHVGDVMDSRVDYLFDGKPFTVRGLVLCEDGWEAADGRFGNRYEPNSLLHHHAPTVEDVLREFALACEDAGNAGPEVARIAAEYAKRLTLAEGEDA